VKWRSNTADKNRLLNEVKIRKIVALKTTFKGFCSTEKKLVLKLLNCVATFDGNHNLTDNKTKSEIQQRIEEFYLDVI